MQMPAVSILPQLSWCIAFQKKILSYFHLSHDFYCEGELVLGGTSVLGFASVLAGASVLEGGLMREGGSVREATWGLGCGAPIAKRLSSPFEQNLHQLCYQIIKNSRINTHCSNYVEIAAIQRGEVPPGLPTL